MRKTILILAVLGVFDVISAHGATNTVDLKDIDRFRVEFDKAPSNIPTNRIPDAPVTGNGDIGLTMCKCDDMVRIYIGKNDFWKALEDYPAGGIELPGGFDISSKEITGGEYHAVSYPGSAFLEATFKTDDNTLSVESRTIADDNIVLVDFLSEKDTEITVNLWTATGLSSVNDNGRTDRCMWVSRCFETDDLNWETKLAMAISSPVNSIELHGGKKKTLVLSVYTNHDSEEWKDIAIKRAETETDSSISELKRKHSSWWQYFWNLSHVSINDPEIEKYYYLSQYYFACSSREGKFAPGLWGPFITQDNTAWAGDYHLNYNYQSPYWGCYSSNQICLTENYDRPILDYMEQGRKNASELLNCRGVYYPVGIGPFGYTCSCWPKDKDRMQKAYGSSDFSIDNGYMFWGQKTNASFSAINMMMRFYSTYDKDYAQLIYPFIIACADFWEDYLVFENGRYVSKNDTFHEINPFNGDKGDLNATTTLGLIHLIFESADNLSKFLGKDSQRRKKWHHILANLSQYPTHLKEDGTLTIQNVEEGRIYYGVNRIHMHGVLIPPLVCGPNLTPEYNSVMRSDLDTWEHVHNKTDWGDSFSNGVETVYAGAVRIGFPSGKVIEFLKDRIKKMPTANCFIPAWGGGVETLAAIPFAINEMLLQSFEGFVRIFPNWDRNKNASFNNLRADGAFLVSSSITDGQIKGVRIISEKGRTCILENPWPNHSVVIKFSKGHAKQLKGKLLTIRTHPGQELNLSQGD